LPCACGARPHLLQHLKMFRSKSKIKEEPKTASPVRGYSPTLPVLIVPGIINQPLKVEESATQPRWKGHRVWVPSKKKLLELKSKSLDYSEGAAVTTKLPNELADMHDQILRHFVMPNPKEETKGIQVRPLTTSGIAGLNLMDSSEVLPEGFMNGNIYQGLLNMLKNSYGYVDEKDVDCATYDWRVPPKIMEERDAFFTKLKQKIEKMNVASQDTRGIVLFGHDMGNNVIRYFVNFIMETSWSGQEWLDHNVHSWVMIGSPNLGASWVGRAIVTGESPYSGMESVFKRSDLLTVFRSLGSLPWLFPTGDQRQNLFFLRREGALEIRRPYVRLAENYVYGIKKKVVLTFRITWTEDESLPEGITEVSSNPSSTYDGTEATWETQDVVVSGAGLAGVNGPYKKSLETKGGRPVYTHISDPNYKIQWNTMQNMWMIDFVPGAAPYCLRDFPELHLPMDQEWEVFQGGLEPAPTVTAKEDNLVWIGGPEKLPGASKLLVQMDEVTQGLSQTVGCFPHLSCWPRKRKHKNGYAESNGSTTNKTPKKALRQSSHTSLHQLLNHTVPDEDGWRNVTLFLPKNNAFNALLCAEAQSSGKVQFQMRWRDAVDLRADWLDVPRNEPGVLDFMFGTGDFAESKDRWTPARNDPCPIRHTTRPDVHYDKVSMEDMLKMLDLKGLLNIWRDYFQNDRFWKGTAMDEPPPLKKILAFMGTNCRTELASVYRIKTHTEPRQWSSRQRFVPDEAAEMIPERQFLLSTSAVSMEDGVVYEDPPTIEDDDDSGDGVVPGKSLRHSRKWRYDIEKLGGIYQEVRLARSPHDMNMFDPNFFTQVNEHLTEAFIL